MATAGDARVMAQYRIAPERMGAVYSALLLLAYTLCMIPGGLLIDRYGPKAALAAPGFGSAVFVAATGAPRWGRAAWGTASPCPGSGS
jgi:hypothetical protein